MKPSYVFSPGEILDHVFEISAQMRDRTGRLGQSFLNACGDKAFSKEQQAILFQNASVTGQMEIGPKYKNLWHLFGEGISKRVSNFEDRPVEDQCRALMDIVIFARWDAHNYGVIFGQDIPEKAPAYPASLRRLPDYATSLAYMRHEVEPAIKSSLGKVLGLDDSALEQQISEREEELLKSKVPGVEAIAAIPAATWRDAPALRGQ